MLIKLVQNGFELKQKSKWFNAVSGYATQNEINQFATNSFVKKIDVVGTFAKRIDDVEFNELQNLLMIIQHNRRNKLTIIMETHSHN